MGVPNIAKAYDGQNNRDRQWYGNSYNNSKPREGQLAIQAAGDGGSGQSSMSKNSNYSGQSYNSNNSRQSNNSTSSKRSYNSTNNSERDGSRQSTSGQLHNIQEDEANFSQSASNNQHDI
ncbi:hypothetical protein KR054_009783 [Drosophila jambulina]|nr:hypothetical protein KR054_009783 [Drosophila jambulina]